MKHLNFLSKSSSQSCGHNVVTLASTVGSPSAHRRGIMLKLVSVLVLVLTFGVGNVWGQASTHSSNVTLTAGTNGSSCTVVISGSSYSGIKMGTGKATGSMSFSVPAGITTVYIHVARWNGDAGNLSVSRSAGTVSPTSISNLTSDSGISGSGSSFTLGTPDNATTAYFYTLTLSAQNSATTITLSTTAKRAVVWGVNTAAAGYSITYHCNGATSNCPSDASGQTKLPATLPTPSKTGCIFAGWYTNEGLTTAAVAGATLSADANLYAKWTTNVTLNRNGVTETINDVVVGTDLDEIDGSGDQGGCSAWTFVGWSKTQRTAQNVSTEMTLVTEVDGSGPYYAVYSHTESGGGSTNGSKTFTFSSIASANSWVNGTAYTPVTINPVSIAGNGGGNNAKYYSSDNTWRMYNGGTVNITVTGGSVTSVSSFPSKTFSISNGTASLSCSETIKFTEITVNYTISGGSTTYYSTTATCCEPLDQINGSINLSHF